MEIYLVPIESIERTTPSWDTQILDVYDLVIVIWFLSRRTCRVIRLHAGQWNVASGIPGRQIPGLWLGDDHPAMPAMPRGSKWFQAAKVRRYFLCLRQASRLSFLWNWRSWGLLGSWSLYGERFLVYLGSRLVLIPIMVLRHISYYVPDLV